MDFKNWKDFQSLRHSVAFRIFSWGMPFSKEISEESLTYKQILVELPGFLYWPYSHPHLLQMILRPQREHLVIQSKDSKLLV